MSLSVVFPLGVERVVNSIPFQIKLDQHLHLKLAHMKVILQEILPRENVMCHMSKAPVLRKNELRKRNLHLSYPHLIKIVCMYLVAHI